LEWPGDDRLAARAGRERAAQISVGGGTPASLQS